MPISTPVGATHRWYARMSEEEMERRSWEWEEWDRDLAAEFEAEIASIREKYRQKYKEKLRAYREECRTAVRVSEVTAQLTKSDPSDKKKVSARAAALLGTNRP